MGRSVKFSLKVRNTQRDTEEVNGVAGPRQPPVSRVKDQYFKCEASQYDGYPEMNCAQLCPGELTEAIP